MRAGRTGGLNQATVPGMLVLPSRFYAGPDGRMYVDVPPQLGYACGLRGVPVMSTGGGFGRYVQTGQSSAVDPTTPSQLPQMLVLFVGPSRAPFAFGQVSAMGGTASTEPAVEDGIRGAGLGVEDHGAVNGGAVLSLDTNGRATVDLRSATDPTLGVQLPAGGTMPVSRAGDASGRLVLVAEMEEYLTDIRAQFATLVSWVSLISAAAGIVPPLVPVPFPAFPNPTARTFGAAAIPVSPDAE